MAIENKKYLDYVGLNQYDELIKQKMSNDIEETGVILDNKITKLGTYSTQEDYVSATGVAKEGVTYYRIFGAGTDLDPFRYEALPYTDPDTGITYIAPAIGTSVEGLYVKQSAEGLNAGLVKEYVDKKFKKALEGVVIYYPVYYVMEYDPISGTYVEVYNYELSEDEEAQPGKTYYKKVGTGSTLDPYRYVETPFTKDEPMYERGDKQTTIYPSEVEKEHPVIDETTGQQVTQAVTYIDDSTTTNIINTMADTATIPENEIIDLFV